MKSQRATIICFSIYALVAFCFMYLYILFQQKTNSPFTSDENDASLVVVLQAIGHGVKEATGEIDVWIRYVAFSILLNFLFLLALKVVVKLDIRQFTLLIIIAHSISFISYLLLHSVLQSIFGMYYSIVLTLLITTYFTVSNFRYLIAPDK